MDLVLARAAELRKAGVLAIGPDSAQFAPWVDPLPDAPKAQHTTEETYPSWDKDPSSFPGGVVPGYEIKPLTEGDEW